MKKQILGIFFLSTLLSVPVFAGWDDPRTTEINEGAIGTWDDPRTTGINEGAIGTWDDPRTTGIYEGAIKNYSY